MGVLSKELYQVAESGDAEGLRDRLRYTALTNLYYFTKVVLGYRELSPRLHQEFCEYGCGWIPFSPHKSWTVVVRTPETGNWFRDGPLNGYRVSACFHASTLSLGI